MRRSLLLLSILSLLLVLGACGASEPAKTADPAATVVFAPRRMGELLRLLERDGIPESPLASGI